ncbi:MAG: hypothetical protein ACO1RT_01870, partial [Planctomycetaceae bacterium]
NPEPVVPGFVVPEPAAPEKPPAKRSAWDSLIGSLGIKTAAEPDAGDDIEPARSGSTPAAEKESTSSRGFANEPSARDRAPKESRRADTPRRGFGSGLVDDTEDVAWPSSVPHERSPERDERSPERGSSARSQEPRSAEPKRREEPSAPRTEPAARRDSVGRESRSSEPRESRFGEPRAARSSEPRSGEPRSSESRGSEPRSSAPRRGDAARPRGFGDGLLDWDTPDDVFVSDEEGAGDASSPTARDSAASDSRRGPQDRSRSDEDRPRGRGRRGGARNRGRGSEPAETPARIAGDEDVIGWHDEIDDADESLESVDQPARRDRGRGDRPRGEVNPQDRRPRGGEPLSAEAPRSDRGRDGGRRDEPRREDRSDEEPGGETRRRGRRGQRQQMGAPATSELRDAPSRGRRDQPARTPELGFGDEDDDLIIDELASPVSDESDVPAEESVGRPRRRRGRRGRGGSGADRGASDRVAPERKEPSARGALDEPAFASELDAIEAVELDDDHEDDDEVERIRRGRRRGRDRGDSGPRSEASFDAAPMAAGAQDEIQAPKHRNVPTWLDTINLLVDSNIERHRRTGPPRSQQGRGGRR